MAGADPATAGSAILDWLPGVYFAGWRRSELLRLPRQPPRPTTEGCILRPLAFIGFPRVYSPDDDVKDIPAHAFRVKLGTIPTAVSEVLIGGCLPEPLTGLGRGRDRCVRGWRSQRRKAWASVQRPYACSPKERNFLHPYFSSDSACPGSLKKLSSTWSSTFTSPMLIVTFFGSMWLVASFTP